MKNQSGINLGSIRVGGIPDLIYLLLKTQPTGSPELFGPVMFQSGDEKEACLLPHLPFPFLATSPLIIWVLIQFLDSISIF